MTGTIEVEEVLKLAEALYLQLKACKELPNSIREILGLEIVSETPSRASPQRQVNGAEGGSGGTTTPSTPDKGTLQINGKVNPAVKFSGASNHRKEGNSTTATTPDDSSIEILPDNMDVAF